MRCICLLICVVLMGCDRPVAVQQPLSPQERLVNAEREVSIARKEIGMLESLDEPDYESEFTLGFYSQRIDQRLTPTAKEPEEQQKILAQTLKRAEMWRLKHPGVRVQPQVLEQLPTHHHSWYNCKVLLHKEQPIESISQ